eukprot:362896-Chlamydomonas_euryale.AAC.6
MAKEQRSTQLYGRTGNLSKPSRGRCKAQFKRSRPSVDNVRVRTSQLVCSCCRRVQYERYYRYRPV